MPRASFRVTVCRPRPSLSRLRRRRRGLFSTPGCRRLCDSLRRSFGDARRATARSRASPLLARRSSRAFSAASRVASLWIFGANHDGSSAASAGPVSRLALLCHLRAYPPRASPDPSRRARGSRGRSPTPGARPWRTPRAPARGAACRARTRRRAPRPRRFDGRADPRTSAGALARPRRARTSRARACGRRASSSSFGTSRQPPRGGAPIVRLRSSSLGDAMMSCLFSSSSSASHCEAEAAPSRTTMSSSLAAASRVAPALAPRRHVAARLASPSRPASAEPGARGSSSSSGARASWDPNFELALEAGYDVVSVSRRGRPGRRGRGAGESGRRAGDATPRDGARHPRRVRFVGCVRAVDMLLASDLNAIASGSGSKPAPGATYDDITRVTASRAADAAAAALPRGASDAPPPFVFVSPPRRVGSARPSTGSGTTSSPNEPSSANSRTNAVKTLRASWPARPRVATLNPPRSRGGGVRARKRRRDPVRGQTRHCRRPRPRRHARVGRRRSRVGRARFQRDGTPRGGNKTGGGVRLGLGEGGSKRRRSRSYDE